MENARNALESEKISMYLKISMIVPPINSEFTICLYLAPHFKNNFLDSFTFLVIHSLQPHLITQFVDEPLATQNYHHQKIYYDQ